MRPSHCRSRVVGLLRGCVSCGVRARVWRMRCGALWECACKRWGGGGAHAAAAHAAGAHAQAAVPRRQRGPSTATHTWRTFFSCCLCGCLSLGPLGLGVLRERGRCLSRPHCAVHRRRPPPRAARCCGGRRATAVAGSSAPTAPLQAAAEAAGRAPQQAAARGSRRSTASGGSGGGSGAPPHPPPGPRCSLDVLGAEHALDLRELAGLLGLPHGGAGAGGGEGPAGEVAIWQGGAAVGRGARSVARLISFCLGPGAQRRQGWLRQGSWKGGSRRRQRVVAGSRRRVDTYSQLPSR